MADEDEKKEDEQETDADVSEGDEEDEDGESSKKGKKGIIIIAAVGLVALIGGGLAMSGILGGDDEKEKEKEKAKQELVKEKPKPVYYELPEFLVNLTNKSGRVSFLKMAVTLELKDKKALPQIEAVKPKILDMFNTYLRELRPSDLSGSAGIYRLREELMARVNKTMGDDAVQDILFSEILVQ